MGFRQHLARVQQAEAALEAQERRVAADWRQLKASWRDTWTPGQIVLAGLAGGYLAGHAQPLRAVARGRQLMRLLTVLSGLFAGGRAHEAAQEAGHAADATRTVAAAVAPAAAAADAATAASAPSPPPRAAEPPPSASAPR